MITRRKGRSLWRSVSQETFSCLVDLDSLRSQRGDWTALFGRSGPLHLEVGFGRGEFLSSLARLKPQVNFLGVEARRKRLCQAALKAQALPNVRLGLGDASLLLAELLGDSCLEAIYINFPDPWPKKRHRRRRIFTPALAREMARVVQPGGMIWLRTDVPELDVLANTFFRATGLLQEVPSPPYLIDVRTEQGNKAITDGRPVLVSAFARGEGPP